MNKSILKNFLILFTGSGINIIIGIITTPIITRIVDPFEYGQLSFFNLYSSLIYVILILGMDQSYVRFFYKKDEVNYKRSLLFNAIKIPISLTIVISIIIFLFRNKITILDNKDDKIIIILFILNIFTLLINRFGFLTIRLQMKTKLLATMNIIYKIIYVISIIVLSKYFSNHYLVILTLSTVISLFIPTIISVFKEKEIWNYRKINVNKEIENIKLLKYGYPYIFSSVISFALQATDKIAIKQFGSFNDVGIYASANNIITLFSIIQTTFSTLWVPICMKSYEDDSTNKSIFELGNQIITIIMFLFGGTLVLFKDVFAIILGGNYSEAIYIIPFLMFNPIMTTISETTVNGINFKEKSKYHIVITSVSGIVNIIGNYILVPVLGYRGAAISTGISYIIFFTMRTIISNKYYYVNFKLKRFYIVTFILSCYSLYNTFYRFNIISVIGYIILLVAIFIFYKDIINLGLNFLKDRYNLIRIKINL